VLVPVAGLRKTRVRLGVLVSVAVLVTICALLSTACDSDQRSSSKVVGDPVRGEHLFRTYCFGCHTLKAARAAGRVGPNLDRMKPSYARVVKQVTNPRIRPGTRLPPSMMTFGPGTFTASEIRDIAAFVFISTHSIG
jgi:mono/diheme cytochrome c family protein